MEAQKAFGGLSGWPGMAGRTEGGVQDDEVVGAGDAFLADKQVCEHQWRQSRKNQEAHSAL